MSMACRDIKQTTMFVHEPPPQLLKWVGNKQRYAPVITQYFPQKFEKYVEPFVGSGAVLGAMAPRTGVAGDSLAPLIQLWRLVQENPASLLSDYSAAWAEFQKDRQRTYEKIRDRFNVEPNPHDLLFISRSCYGGVVRFTRQGKLSTPVGAHDPISPDSLSKRLHGWRTRIANVNFLNQDFEVTLNLAGKNDVVYCDPPYYHAQAILYGAQNFLLERLFRAIKECKNRGAFVALSIDGTKKSGRFIAKFPIPSDLFEREIQICCGRSMLRRFQKKGESLEDEVVNDRLLLTR